MDPVHSVLPWSGAVFGRHKWFRIWNLLFSWYQDALPNSHQCETAFNAIQSASLGLVLTEEHAEGYKALLDTFCTIDCGKAIAQYMASNCKAVLPASMLYLSRESSTDRCRSAFPDFWTAAMDYSASANFKTKCLSGCKSVLTALTKEMGCCFQSLYSDFYFVLSFLNSGFLSVENNESFAVIKNPLLWHACGVPHPNYCTGKPFNGKGNHSLEKKTLAAEICTNLQMFDFIQSLPESCATVKLWRNLLSPK